MCRSVRSSLIPRSACSRARAAGGNRAVQNARALARRLRCSVVVAADSWKLGSRARSWGARDSGTAGQTAANACSCCITAVPPTVPSTPICPGRSRRIHSFLTFPAFATRCVGGTARGRIRGGHGQHSLKIEDATADATGNAGPSAPAKLRSPTPMSGRVFHCTVLEDAPFWHKSCNIVKSSF